MIVLLLGGCLFAGSYSFRMTMENDLHQSLFCYDRAQHKAMAQSFWHENRIRSPKCSASGSVDSAQKVFSDATKVSTTILQDYHNDIKKRFRNGSGPAKWKEWPESHKRASVKSYVDESVTDSSLNSEESLKLQLPSASASSASKLEWRMETFLLSSDDYQRYSLFVLNFDDCK